MLTKLYVAVQSFFMRDDEGATALEYGLLVGLIALAIVVAVGLLGTNLNTMFNAVATRVGTIPLPAP